MRYFAMISATSPEQVTYRCNEEGMKLNVDEILPLLSLYSDNLQTIVWPEAYRTKTTNFFKTTNIFLSRHY